MPPWPKDDQKGNLPAGCSSVTRVAIGGDLGDVGLVSDDLVGANLGPLQFNK